MPPPPPPENCENKERRRALLMHSETLYADLMAALVCSLFLFVNLFVSGFFKRGVRSLIVLQGQMQDF